MTARTMTRLMHRAGIGSRRELSELTGIPSRTLDRIFNYPRQARGFQLDELARVMGLSDTETREMLRKEEKK